MSTKATPLVTKINVVYLYVRNMDAASRFFTGLLSLADPKNTHRNALVETRNQYTHQGEPGPNVIPDADLYAHVERFIEVLEVNLLLDLGLDADEIPALHANAHPS